MDCTGIAFDFTLLALILLILSKLSSICTTLESILGVREILDDFVPVLRKMFESSEFVELLVSVNVLL